MLRPPEVTHNFADLWFKFHNLFRECPIGGVSMYCYQGSGYAPYAYQIGPPASSPPNFFWGGRVKNLKGFYRPSYGVSNNVKIGGGGPPFILEI